MKNTIITLLGIAMAGLLVYQYKITNENSLFKQEVLEEKKSLEDDFALALQNLNHKQEQNIAITKDFNQTNKKLKEIRVDLEKSKKKLEHLKNKLHQTKEQSFRIFHVMRDSLQGLKTNNKLLFDRLDSIRSSNDSLRVAIAVVKSELNIERLKSEKITSKLAKATKFIISQVEVYGVREKKSGRLKKTNRYKKVDAIKVQFSIINNRLLANEALDVFYVIKNSKEDLVKPTGEFFHGKILKKYTDGTRLVSNGETMRVTHQISLKDAALSKGSYTIEFYSLDGLLAKERFILKTNFLGVF
ncbi:MAG: hypothetical protein ACN4EF_00560 [Wenyingzhuangia sp.]|jgi:hypothetical protein|uniref:hypothetical protein n=2 Tax=Wenyingzhuangia sp. TaxID=1964193 RepID=UPI00321B55F8